MAHTSKYAIVQHSGYYTGHSEFARAVESMFLDRAADIRKVEKAGGVLFDDYTAAEDFCEKANYPEHVAGLIPDAQGRFSEWSVLGQAIYVPVREVVR